jgi:DNA modification methylase
MPAYLASRLAERYSEKGGVVLDPFCGSGAVLVEAAKLGRSVIGTDLLELSTKISKAPFQLRDPVKLYDLWKDIHLEALDDMSLFSNTVPDKITLSEPHEHLSIWFHKETFVEILSLYKVIKKMDNEDFKNIFTLILSSCLMSLSNRSSRGVLHWGWIADNVKPNRHDLLRTDVFKEMERRIVKLVGFMKATNGYKKLATSEVSVYMYNWLSDEVLTSIHKDSVDLLLTSPPYPYSIDYTLALRLTHYLLEQPFDIKRKDEIGARFKRKRKGRESEYIQELATSLNKSSVFVKLGGKAVFVLPHPDEYSAVINMSVEQWLDFIKVSFQGTWDVVEIGFRDCIKRRVVHVTKTSRQELVAVFQRVK